RGTAPDEAKAREWYEKSVRAGYSYALSSLIELLIKAQDFNRLAFWFQKEADAGDYWGMVGLANLYESGHIGATDPAKAGEWYEKAIAAGGAAAMLQIGYSYNSGLAPRDLVKAREWFEKAASAGNTQAMCQIGLFYDLGRAGPQDYGKAREWYEKAAAA